MVNKWFDFIQQRLFPSSCVLCRGHAADGLDLCPGCLRDLPRPAHACRRCALPLPPHSHPLCGRCQSRPPPLDACIALFHYEFPVDHLIHRLKFCNDLAIGRTLGLLLARRIQAPGPAAVERIVPVPLHRRRLAQRGFNQALELARPLAALGPPVDPGCCRKIRATEAQSGLSARQRRRNLRGAFEVIRPVRGQRIALVDDVLTTGSTLNALAAQLKQAGAARVEAWVVARTARR